ncbi:hypothetical protein [Sphingobium sp. B2]|uniref:hypothetical protein n=1 Tax=Sphingobium sp. B2 TaxID=2583228 RepID=UPI00396575BF
MLATLKAWAWRLKREVLALWIAARSPDTPLPARLIALLVAAYALSPVSYTHLDVYKRQRLARST